MWPVRDTHIVFALKAVFKRWILPLSPQPSADEEVSEGREQVKFHNDRFPSQKITLYSPPTSGNTLSKPNTFMAPNSIFYSHSQCTGAKMTIAATMMGWGCTAGILKVKGQLPGGKVL